MLFVGLSRSAIRSRRRKACPRNGKGSCASSCDDIPDKTDGHYPSASSRIWMHDGNFDYVCAVEVSKFASAPRGLFNRAVPAQKYAVLSASRARLDDRRCLFRDLEPLASRPQYPRGRRRLSRAASRSLRSPDRSRRRRDMDSDQGRGVTARRTPVPQHSTKFTASPPSEVSLYFDCMSAPVWRMVAMT